MEWPKENLDKNYRLKSSRKVELLSELILDQAGASMNPDDYEQLEGLLTELVRFLKECEKNK